MTPQMILPEHSDLEIIERVNFRFSIMREMVEGVAVKALAGIVIHGEGGIGKTYTVEQVLADFKEARKIDYMTGHISPLALYNRLYQNSGDDDITVFDDSDSAFSDVKCLNTMKAALDTKAHRVVSWDSNSKLVATPSFQMQGRVIVITNQNLGSSEHFRAFLDRIHSFPLHLSPREKILKIREIASGNSEIPEDISNDVIKFLLDNYEKFGRSLSLRTFVKTCDLARFSRRWKEMAEITIFTNEVVQ